RLGLDESETTRVTCGALLHDLGHSPFSHTLEATMREALGHGHEPESRAWIVGSHVWPSGHRKQEPPSLPEVLERFGVEPKAVADLVDPGARPKGPPLLGSMLHGAIDADRMDYLQRDAHYTGVAHGAIDAVRLLDTVRARDGRLVFAEKGRAAVEGFLVGRALMYASVYYHKTVRAAEVMAQGAVERIHGYPESAPPLLRGNDGELLVALHREGGVPARLVRGLTERELFKRAHGWRTLGASERRKFRALIADPVARRGAEDGLAERLRAPAGSVLLDLAGLEGRTSPESDWAEVALVDDDRVSHPFRAPSVWQALAMRPPTRSLVSIYAEPSIVPALERRAERGDLGLP
ncbi:MAG: HD domain-containing protein, partial [Thermoplasmata archaeon]|nr:HD domain-containing protein [Thermoplasmata archaeon]